MSDTISFTQTAGIATLTFNNPQRRNALGAAELDAIESGLSSLDENARALLITSSDDRVFCAGADLTQILDGSLSGDRFQSVTNKIAALPIPSIATLSGNVFGGGAELARYRRSDFPHHLVLHIENVFEVAIITIRPHVVAVFCFDELGRDAHPVSGLSHAALDDIMDAEFAPNVLNPGRLILVMERGVPRDDEQ